MAIFENEDYTPLFCSFCGKELKILKVEYTKKRNSYDGSIVKRAYVMCPNRTGILSKHDKYSTTVHYGNRLFRF